LQQKLIVSIFQYRLLLTRAPEKDLAMIQTIIASLSNKLDRLKNPIREIQQKKVSGKRAKADKVEQYMRGLHEIFQFYSKQ
jgi:hypothetical protein